MARLLSLDALRGLPAGPGRVRVELVGDRWLAGTHLLDGTTGALECWSATPPARASRPRRSPPPGSPPSRTGCWTRPSCRIRGLGDVPVDAAAELRGIFPRRVPYLFADF